MVELLQSNLFGNLALQDLSDFESSNNFELPRDYKDFLIAHNGGRPVKNHLPNPSTDVNWLYGMHDGPEWASFFFGFKLLQW